MCGVHANQMEHIISNVHMLITVVNVIFKLR